VGLSANEMRTLAAYNPRLSQKNIGYDHNLPSSVDVGMNNTPVLDQGRFASCVTFAATAAFDALIGKGDYVSQLCHLELGRYLEQRSDQPSGWNYTQGPTVLNRIMSFGIINKDKQKQGVCGGVTEYPVHSEASIEAQMSLDEFHAAREKVNGVFYWESLLTQEQRFHDDDGYDAEKMLLSVKKSLATQLSGRQSRLIFGALLPVDHCFAGACAKHHQVSDTWALTNAIDNDPTPQLSGHNMVITGYDDDATVVDNEGQTHQGLLTIRNSWGSNVGDQGDYYMTYDFFKKYTYEVQRIVRRDALLDA
jgi:hypothetical protein